MSYSHQAVPDVRFCNNERDGGGAVSGTASSEQRFDSIPVSRPSNAKSTNSTNIIVSGDSIHNNVPQGRAKPSSKNPIKWKEGKRQQLADFKRKFLHTNVPQTYAENKPLGRWVSDQRRQYVLLKAKRTSLMTMERIQSLEELDFEWQRVTTRTWEESRQQLADFKRKFRHTNVPQTYAEDKPLGAWVSNQRTQYRLFKANNKSNMTRERIQSLKELDFEWKVRTRPYSSSLVERSLSSTTEDGYESDNSELYLII